MHAATNSLLTIYTGTIINVPIDLPKIRPEGQRQCVSCEHKGQVFNLFFRRQCELANSAGYLPFAKAWCLSSNSSKGKNMILLFENEVPFDFLGEAKF